MVCNQHEDLLLKSALEATPMETATVWSAEYKGKECYAIVHNKSGFVTIFDYNKTIFNALKRMLKKGYSLSCYKDVGGLPRFKLDNKIKGKPNIELRKFLYARYNKIPLHKIGRVYVYEGAQHNILDLRRQNIYAPGNSIEHRDDISISIEQRPDKPGEKYIRIDYDSGGTVLTAYSSYTPELYEILTHQRYCKVLIALQNKRLKVSIHYGKGEYTMCSLSKLLLIYKLHFGEYKHKRGGIKRFVQDFNKLNKEYGDKDAAHVNACRWNNCFENLVLMDKSDNNEMSDDIKYFSGRYHAYTAVNDREEILVELSCAGVSGNGVTTLYFRCKTPGDYKDLQKYFLGKEITGKLQVATIATKDGIQQVLTPRGMILTGEANKETARANEPDIWEWAAHRDKLLELDAADAAAFRLWDAGAVRKLSVPMPEKMAVGEPFVAPYGGGHVIITPVKMGNT